MWPFKKRQDYAAELKTMSECLKRMNEINRVQSNAIAEALELIRQLKEEWPDNLK